MQRVFLFGLLCSFVLPLKTTVGGIPVYPFDLVLLPLTVVWVADLVYFRRGYTVSSAEMLLYSLVGWIFVTGFFALDSKLAVTGGLIWLRIAVVFSIVRTTYKRVYSERDVYAITAILIYTQAILVVIQAVTQTDFGALNQYFGSKTALKSYQSVAGHELYRAQGTLGNPNTVANWFILLMPIAVVAAQKIEHSVLKRAYAWSVVFSVIAILLTFSEGSIALLGGYFILGGVLYLRDYVQRDLLTLLVAYSGLVFAVIVATLPWGRLSSVRSLSKRLELGSLAVYLVARRPFVGTGYDNFVAGVQRLLGGTNLFFGASTSSVHNIPLLFAAETGIFGAVLFVGFIALVFRSLVSSYVSTSDRITTEAGFLVSFSGLVGILMIYTTFSSFQFLPLAIVVVAAGGVIRTNHSTSEDIADGFTTEPTA